MKRLALWFCICASSAIAQTEVPNELKDGSVASATEVMENFQALGDAIDQLPLPPSTCLPSQFITWGKNGWQCADSPTTGLETSIQELESRLQTLEGQSATFATEPYILGVSSSSTRGYVNFNGSTGTRGATEMCRASYPSYDRAHLCGISEIYGALSQGNFADTTFDGTETWTVTGGVWGGGYGGSNSVNHSCFDLAYNSGHSAQGVSATVYFQAVTGDGYIADYVNVSYGRACNTTMPVLCCR